MTVRFEALPTDAVRRLQNGGTDAYDHAPDRRVSDGNGVPCRHCLENIKAGDPYLVVAYCPFETLQPYAETGPIFLHSETCTRAQPGDALPPILSSRSYILRGYDAAEEIIYGTGAVVPTDDLNTRAEDLLADDHVAFVHVRSASNNCYQCRIDRA